ncbi:unnamed protein product [Closterium sp. NIES-54]
MYSPASFSSPSPHYPPGYMLFRGKALLKDAARMPDTPELDDEKKRKKEKGGGETATAAASTGAAGATAATDPATTNSSAPGTGSEEASPAASSSAPKRTSEMQSWDMEAMVGPAGVTVSGDGAGGGAGEGSGVPGLAFTGGQVSKIDLDGQLEVLKWILDAKRKEQRRSGTGPAEQRNRFSAAQWNRSSGAAEQVFSGAAEQVQRRSGIGSAAQRNRSSGAAEQVQRRSRTGPAAQQNRSAAQQNRDFSAALRAKWQLQLPLSSETSSSLTSLPSNNFGEWCYGVEKHLLSSELKGICLKDILFNRGKGKMPLPLDHLGEGATATAKLAFDAKTTKYETDFSLWEQADAAVIRVFITTTPVELVKSYRTFRSAHDIWKYLQDRFHDKTAVGVAILSPRMFQTRLEECLGMADYISEIRNIHEELKDIGITFPEQAPAAGLLVGLTPAYNVTSSMLKQLPTKELTFEKVTSALLSAEKDLAAQASVNAGPRAGQKCNGTNHPEATCFKKRDDEWYDVHGVSKDKRPPHWAPPRRMNQVKAVEEPAQAFASAPYDVRLNLLFSGAGLINEKGSQYIGVSTTQGIEFILDSGATHTVLKDQTAFVPYQAPTSLLGADSSFSIQCHGSSTVSCPAFPSGTVTGICAPTLRYNLLAQRKIQHAGVITIFPNDVDYCNMLDAKTGLHLARFTLNSNNLYTLVVPPVQTCSLTNLPLPSSYSPSCHCRLLNDKTMLFHNRLGHINFRALSDLATKQLLHGLPASLPQPPSLSGPPCLDCAQSKLREQPHPPTESTSTAPLDRVHMDLWGPAPVRSRGGHFYFLVIVDDYSRCVSVHLLTAKSEAPAIIMEWARQAHSHFKTKIKILHSDGGGEFRNNTLKAFCSTEGIRQTFTLPDSPQQNGVAESRNRILVQIARCLLTHASAPPSLWGCAMLHAAALHNLHPHPHHTHTTPAELWTGQKPSVRPLRVWGCTSNTSRRRTSYRVGVSLPPRLRTQSSVAR